MWFLQPGITIQDILLHILAVWMVVFLTMPFHGYIETLVAERLGDSTAKSKRLKSLNPITHFSMRGFLALLLFNVGWGHTIPTNPSNFRNPKKGSIIVGLSGIISYFVAAIVGSVIMYLTLFFCIENYILTLFISIYIVINVSQAIFNLIPLSSLDGYKILSGILSEETLDKYRNYQGIVEFIVFSLLIFGVFDAQYDFLTMEVTKIIFKITSLPFLFIK